MDRLLSRIGKSKSLFDVEITIHTVELNTQDPKVLKISWQKRQKCAETQEFLITSSAPSVTLNASLFMSNTLYTKNSEYLEKITKLKLNQKVRNDWITLSQLSLDLSNYIHKPLTHHDFFFSFNTHKCTLKISIQCHSTQGTETYSIEKNILDTHEKFEMILKDYNERQEEVESLKREVESLTKSLEDAKNNRSESFLEAEQ